MTVPSLTSRAKRLVGKRGFIDAVRRTGASLKRENPEAENTVLQRLYTLAHLATEKPSYLAALIQHRRTSGMTAEQVDPLKFVLDLALPDNPNLVSRGLAALRPALRAKLKPEHVHLGALVPDLIEESTTLEVRANAASAQLSECRIIDHANGNLVIRADADILAKLQPPCDAWLFVRVRQQSNHFILEVTDATRTGIRSFG